LTSPPRALYDRQAAEQSTPQTWLPSTVVDNLRTRRHAERPAVRCRAVRHPAQFSGLDLLTVLTLDLAKGITPVDADGLMADAQTVYASSRGLYVASQRYSPAVATESGTPPDGMSTAIHRFDISGEAATTYRGSGRVRGHLLNQFSLSEHRGVLRVASTDVPLWFGPGERQESESFVTTLEERDGALVELGRVGGLGRGERIYAVRFIEDAGYVVTFRQVDPLYTLDLADPRAPRVRGELKILGYSAYLHPLGGDLLLGVGQDATEQGRRLGAQLSLFDVGDPARPARLHQHSLGELSSSEVEYDHRAFLHWKGLAVLPTASRGFTGAAGFTVDRQAGIAEAGRVTHSASGLPVAVRRAIVVGDRLLTLSEAGLRSSRLSDLADVAWVPFGM